MTHVIFYEKPGCAGNARQRAALASAGHTITRRSLLETRWTAGELLAFFGSMPVAQWFNRAAPRIKSGALVPEALDARSAIAELLADPLLIRRPLMQRADGARMVGFEIADVERFVGLGAQAPAASSLEGCANGARGGGCPTADAPADQR
jgi:nitrogenase-associated protein